MAAREHSAYSTIRFATVAWAARLSMQSAGSHFLSRFGCVKLHGRGRTKQSRAARPQVRWENGAATATAAATVASVSSRDSRCATKRHVETEKSTAIHSPGVASSSGTYGQAIPSRLRLCDGHNESWYAYTSAEEEVEEEEEEEEGGTAPYRRATGAGLVRSSARATRLHGAASAWYTVLPCCWLHYMYARTTSSSDDGVFVHTYITQLYLRERLCNLVYIICYEFQLRALRALLCDRRVREETA
ncbi:unnamed protein product, partial [Trichogramma brassicae]